VVIIGAGMIGEVHRRAATLAGADIVGVMASTVDRSCDVAAAWGTSPIHDADHLAAVGPDVVHVCSPNGLHTTHVEAALRAKAHVICEKPLATCTAHAERLAVAAANADRIATVPFVYRFHPLVRELRERARGGEFGTWQLLHGSYLQDWLLDPNATSWRVDAAQGGPSRTFADIGSHWCDLMEFVTGERIAEVFAAMATTVADRPITASASFTGAAAPTARRAVTTEDAATVLFRTATGVLGALTVSQVSAGRKNRLWFEFDGATRSAVFDQENPETVWLGGEREAVILTRDPSTGSVDQRRLSRLPAGHVQGYAQCFEAFVEDTYATIRGETRLGVPTFDDGVRSARIVDAVVESAASNHWVPVP